MKLVAFSASFMPALCLFLFQIKNEHILGRWGAHKNMEIKVTPDLIRENNILWKKISKWNKADEKTYGVVVDIENLIYL